MPSCTSRPGSGRTWPAGADQQRLGAHANLPVQIRQNASSQASAASRDRGLRVQADKLPGRLTVQVHGEFRVDEIPLGDVQGAGHAVAAVRDG